MNINELQTFIRTNGYAWPGGYPCYLVMADGEAINAKSARRNYRQLRVAMKSPGTNSQWEPIGVQVHREGESIFCADSGDEIESAYGIPE